MAFDTIFNEPFLTRRPLFLFSFSAPRSLWKQDEGEVQQLWGRGETRKAKTMSTMYNPGDREWQTFQRRPSRIKMITPSAWFFHPHKLFPIFRKIQKYFQTLVSSTIQLRYGAKLYAALESGSTSKNPFKLSTCNWSFQLERQNIRHRYLKPNF